MAIAPPGIKHQQAEYKTKSDPNLARMPVRIAFFSCSSNAGAGVNCPGPPVNTISVYSNLDYRPCDRFKYSAICSILVSTAAASARVESAFGANSCPDRPFISPV